MALSIGTLIGYLQLDDTNFERKAQAADRKMSAMQLHLQALARENPQISVEVQTHMEALDVLKAKLEELQAQARDGADVRLDMVTTQIGIDRISEKLRVLHREAVRPAKVNVSTAEANAKLDETIAKAGLLHRILNGGFLGSALGLGGGGLLGAILPAAVPLAGAGLGAAAFGGLGLTAVHQTNEEAKKAAQLQKKGQALQAQAAEYQKKAAETLANLGMKNSMASQAYLQKAAQLEALAKKAATQAGKQSLEQRAAAYRQKAAQVGGTYTSAAAQKRAADYQQKAADYSSQGADLIKQARDMLSVPQKALMEAQSNLKAAFDKLMADPAFLRPFTALFNLLAKDMPLITPLIHAMSKILTGMFRDLGKHPEEFRKFIAWIVAQLPIAGHLLKEAAPLFGNLIHGFLEAAPVGVAVLSALLTLLGKLGPATLPVAMGLAGLFLGPEVAAGAAIVGILIALYTHSKSLRAELSKLRGWFERTGSTIEKNLQPVVDQLHKTWHDDLVPAFKQSKPILKDIAKHAGEIASKIGDIVSKIFGTDGPGLIKGFGRIVETVGPKVLGYFDSLLQTLGLIVDAIDTITNGLGKIHAPGTGNGKADAIIKPGLIATLGVFGSLLGANAAGTNDWRGGLTRLAENGPELVYGPTVANLAPHSKVIPAGRTQSMLSEDRQPRRGPNGHMFTGPISITNPTDFRDVMRKIDRHHRTAALGGAFA